MVAHPRTFTTAPLTIDQESPLHTSPYNLVDKMPRSASDPLPDLLQCVRHSKFRSICGLGLPELASNFISFGNIFPHFLNEKIKKMGSDNLI